MKEDNSLVVVLVVPISVASPCPYPYPMTQWYSPAPVSTSQEVWEDRGTPTSPSAHEASASPAPLVLRPSPRG